MTRASSANIHRTIIPNEQLPEGDSENSKACPEM